jgi:anti-sigma factor RsiW
MKGSHPDHDHAHRCRDFLEQLSRYLDDDLPAANRRTIQKHLADCPCCEDVLESLKDTVTLCHESRPSLPRDVRARARERVRNLLSEMGQAR